MTLLSALRCKWAQTLALFVVLIFCLMTAQGFPSPILCVHLFCLVVWWIILSCSHCFIRAQDHAGVLCRLLLVRSVLVFQQTRVLIAPDFSFRCILALGIITRQLFTFWRLPSGSFLVWIFWFEWAQTLAHYCTYWIFHFPSGCTLDSPCPTCPVFMQIF